MILVFVFIRLVDFNKSTKNSRAFQARNC